MSDYGYIVLAGLLGVAIGAGVIKGFKLKDFEFNVNPNPLGGSIVILLSVVAFLVGSVGIVSEVGILGNSSDNKAIPTKTSYSSSPSVSSTSTSAPPVSEPSATSTTVANSQLTANPSPSTVAPQLNPTQQLSALATSDRSTVETTLLNHWVPQVASGVVGLKVGSQTMTANLLLTRHLGLEKSYGALLLYTKGFAYTHQDYWASVVPQTFSGGEAALSWCRDHSLGASDCFAVLLTHDQSIKVTAMYQ